MNTFLIVSENEVKAEIDKQLEGESEELKEICYQDIELINIVLLYLSLKKIYYKKLSQGYGSIQEQLYDNDKYHEDFDERVRELVEN